MAQLLNTNISAGISLLETVANVAFPPFGTAISVTVSSVEELLTMISGSPSPPSPANTITTFELVAVVTDALQQSALEASNAEVNSVYNTYTSNLSALADISPSSAATSPEMKTLYAFLQGQVANTASTTLYNAICSLVAPDSDAGANAANNQQALNMSSLIFAVSALVQMTLTKIGIDAQNGDPDDQNFQDAERLCNWLTIEPAILNDQTYLGWINYIDGVSNALQNQINDRTNLVVGAIPYTSPDGDNDDLYIDFMAYFVDNGLTDYTVPIFTPNLINPQVAQLGLDGLPGDNSASTAAGLNPNSIYSLDGIAAHTFSLTDDSVDNTPTINNVNAVKNAYIAALTQAIHSYYFDPAQTIGVISNLKTTVSKLNIIINAKKALLQ